MFTKQPTIVFRGVIRSIIIIAICAATPIAAQTSIIDYSTYSAEQRAADSIAFYERVFAIDEVVVTASESKGVTSGSMIDSTAMRHLQPTSFTDLMELLPGGVSQDPSMGAPNLIKIREASSDDMSSLGVGFVVDGVTLSNDANLQYISGAGTDASSRTNISKGIDMRTIATDNIESVEVIRGIPSAEHGDLTSGLVIINRKRTASPFTARIKSDEYSTLVSAGKGFELGRNNNVLNADISFLTTTLDPRNTLENYKRATASLRWNAERKVGYGSTLRWTISGDYTGSFDEVREDEDLSDYTNLYRSSYDKYSANTQLNLSFNNNRFWRSLNFSAAASHEVNKLEQTKHVFLSKPTATPTATEQGENDGLYLPYNYIANVTMDGRPLYLNTRINSESKFNVGKSSHTLKMGLEWNYSKNLGVGEQFDPNAPLASLTGIINRPRVLSDIPSMQRMSFYFDETMNWNIGGSLLTTSIGARATMALNLADEYAMKGDVMLDPRINAMWRFPVVNGWTFDLSGGIGWLSKMPTLAQLYPALQYEDITQINYYHSDEALRLINYMTYVWDNTNYDLVAAQNRKAEVRFGLSKGGNNLSVTYFREKMENGFGTVGYAKSLQYKKYDTSSIDDNALTTAPDLSTVDYEIDALINTYTKVANNTNTYKEGVEFQFSSKRIEAIKTRITTNGAWFRTTYSTLAEQYKEKNILLNGTQLAYVGIYQWEDGRVYEQMTTNTIFDTYIDKIGMIFSTSFQCTWYKSNQVLWNDGVPTHYVDKWGEQHPFTESDKTDMALQHLVYSYAGGYFDTNTTPFAMDINLKVTKKIGKYLDMSLFVNRLFSVYPDYYVGDLLVRRSSTPYFGMEANARF